MITNIESLPPAVQQHYDDTLLAIKTPTLIMKYGAVQKVMPSKDGTTLVMSRYDRLPTAPVPLGTSGAPIPATPVTRVDINAKMSFYGQYVALNQQVTLQNNDSVLNSVVKLLGLSLRQTEDQLTRDMLAASASMVNCVGGVNGDLPTDLALSDINDIAAVLLTNDAYKMIDSTEASDKFGTSPNMASYMCLSHTNISKDLKNIPGWNPISNYPRQENILSSEYGCIEEVRFFLSSVASVSPNASLLGNDVYNNFVMGMEAYGCIEQDNYSANVIYRPGIFSDALGQNATLGFCFAECPVLLNELWIMNLRCTLRRS